jgi:uncharacterized protein (DUF488 family)
MLLTFGHGAGSSEQIISLLRDAGISELVDIRTSPGSRRHPHVARAALQRWLPEAGIRYRWEKRLGGLRSAEPDSPDVAFEIDSLRGYAAHMRSPAFEAAVDEVLALARERGTAMMCAESLWWRCHRRMVADFVTAVRDVPVRHLMHDGRLEEHQLSPGLRLREDGQLVYDGGQPTLLLAQAGSRSARKPEVRQAVPAAVIAKAS